MIEIELRLQILIFLGVRPIPLSNPFYSFSSFTAHPLKLFLATPLNVILDFSKSLTWMPDMYSI